MLENDNSIQWIERKHTYKSKVTPLAMRRSTAKLDRLLTADMRDASREIDRAYDDRKKGYGYCPLGVRMVRFDPPARGSVTDEMIDISRKRITKLTIWERECPGFLKATVYSLNQLPHTIVSYANELNKTAKEIECWYVEGLRVYVKLHL